MAFRRFESKRACRIVLGLSLLGAFHFTVSVAVWAPFVTILPFNGVVPWYSAVHAIPALVLLALFCGASWLAWKGFKASFPALLISVLLTCGLLAYDLGTRNWQLHMECMDGSPQKTFHYFNWWWYDERWLS